MQIKITIKSWLGKVLFEYEKEENTIKETLMEALKSDADLRDANLHGADLRGAVLHGADLRGADLRDANLHGAVLRDANLRDADLRDADLHGADLSGADLRGANLHGANLHGADLRDANLRDADLHGAVLHDANLRDAVLRGADLKTIKADLWNVLLKAIPEIPNLKKSLVEGKVDGSTYDGECSCLCGTLEKSDNKKLSKIIFDQRDSSRPIERLFLGIKKGDTPETNPVSKIVMEWICEFEGYINAGVPS